ncbi:DNA polymerase III subunit gamma/tau [Tenacibaculum finnmarkense]|uniref:DNA polymerase III subunit gamma/tau n=1 Tax=Tenacibaculum finnmarkense genomovar finnmarkense TaxID=1458503 RepID=A0AAP1RGK2_9FLAO|nr:DNA polymerase III subunit gamma/tau [Tenacibaculum finnmarkense]MBE7653669.1 DNA polymerase III subunit gamma/tau [Tenacibaculum finnmarkense genomovar finnmarkense]MBE7695939.1 DNA polymerase III subunit gamma/tau [Tenacibaculum finnmarkense genomovar finnmarkense]MCD8428152.1 DNA polymerase III subunit gamma/tau [Tenacibaculum finnmarkense genomovar finnmarkense]MCG8731942.1 DNA polymerase III subunit gamma/tau [Tenacibaculum finnmarkense]MCG8739902.1 DNA polymerase III subunit gamma/tau
MEHFIVSARKYRPQIFEDVVGQQAITNTLENAIKNDHLAQALLFTGPRGVGKTSCARILAKRINQEDNTTVKTDEDFAFNIFELDAASNNSVDDIRNLTDQVRIPPQTGKYKVYIIDEVHMLSQAAFNAFLKTLEEPPAHAIFILATTEKHKIIPTILSRCQIFDFKRIGVLDAKEYLKTICIKENITADDDALHIIAQKADGAMRDALSIFDRVISFSGKNLTREAVTQNLNVLDYDVYFTITDLLIEQKIPQVLLAFNAVLNKGFEGHHFINGLASHFRDLLVSKDAATISLLEVGDTTKKKYFEQSKKASMQFLLLGIDKANDCDLKYRGSKNQRLLVELTLMQIASINFDGAKKKSSNYIIPATFFTSLSPVKNSIAPPIVKSTVKIATAAPIKPLISATSQSSSKPLLKNIKRRTSGLSLKSIHQKPVVKNTEDDSENFENHPKTLFTDKELKDAWKVYTLKTQQLGDLSIASVLASSQPVLAKEYTVTFAIPNELMQVQLERIKAKFTRFLREKLNNYAIQITIVVNEVVEKKFAYTPQEKFTKLKEKNPLIEKLKSVFGLSL